MKALITGACGFVGRHLAHHLRECGDVVMGTDKSKDAPGIPDILYEKLDIRNFEECSRVIGSFAPDVIYHLAGIAFVPDAEKNFDDTLAINVGGVHNVIRIPHLLERKTTIVVVSSAEVYGKIASGNLPITENTPLQPTTNYGLSKVFGEQVAERYGRGKWINSVIVRPFNHIGPGQSEQFVASNFAKQIASIKKGKQEPVLFVGNLDAKRDFTDVRDIVRGYRMAAVKGKGVYNLSSTKTYSIRELLEKLIEISGVSIDLKVDSNRLRPSDIPVLSGDASKARQELGWEPELSLDKSLQDLLNYWENKV